MTQGIPGTSFNAQSTSFSAATGVLGCSLVLSFGPRGMDKLDVQKYYKPTPIPTLYMGQVSNVLGRVPLSAH
jgi:hypothetical protein